MKLKNIIPIICLGLLFSNLALSQTNTVVKKQQVLQKAKSLNILPSKTASKITLRNQLENGSLQAALSVRADASDAVVWSENFDNGSAGWVFESSSPSDLSWTVKTNLTGNYSFKTIVSDDKGSLMSESPYQYYKRGTASAISPQIEMPRNAKLSFYLGCSTNFSKDCNLTLKVQEENGEWKSIWDVNSAGLTPQSFQWRHINIDLAAYSNKNIKLSWFYDGYMGNFYLDSIAVSGVKAIKQLEVKTGQKIELIDISTGEPTSWLWNFPGGTPSSSTEQNPVVYYTKDGIYDVSLTISNATETSSSTNTEFIKVTGSAPVAIIQTPATFRSFTSRLPFIAPLQAVEFKDASLNYPTERSWVFSGVSEKAAENYITSDESPLVNYMFRNNQTVGLSVQNQHGQSDAYTTVTVGYDGLIWNLQPNDKISTFDLDGGYGSFPGSNKLKITEYAEKFSKPSTPGLIYGVNVYFSKYKATEIIEQISSIKVAICKSENGLPGEQLDFVSWMAFEIDLDGTPTSFEFSKPVLVDDEFFIVVSGIPEYNDGCDVAFYTTGFRDQGNTAYFKQRDEWKQASNYFPAGKNHTSYAIAPYIAHSVMVPLSETPVVVGKQDGVTNVEFFSILGYEVKSVSADWCKVVSSPNGLTLDTIKIAYNAIPETISERTAIITLTDGVQSIPIELKQVNISTGINLTHKDKISITPTVFSHSFVINLPEDSKQIDIYNTSGQRVLSKKTLQKEETYEVIASDWNEGIYIIYIQTTSGNKTMKGIKVK